MANIDDALGSTATPPPDYAQHYFWHAKAWAALTRDLDKVPHALLFHGPGGLGKRAFAWRLAKSLLCIAPGSDAAACGACRSCRLFEAGGHPDLVSVTPQGESGSIVVDQVRAVGQFVTLRPHTATRKLVLIEPAEAMNLSAANGFLKVLEEPPSSSALLLITPQAARLAATIRSRCTLVPFRPPMSADAVNWLRDRGVKDSIAEASLKLAGGAPLRAIECASSDELAMYDSWINDVTAVKAGSKDPLSCARGWKDFGVERCLDWFQRYLAELIRAEAERVTVDKNRKSLRDLFCYLDVLSESKILGHGPLDQALILEDMLIRWSRLGGAWSKLSHGYG